MGVITSSVIKNIFDKKIRSLLIVLSIMTSSALFFLSMDISDTMVKMLSDRLKQHYGNTDIIIQPKGNGGQGLFTKEGVRLFEDSLEYAVGAMRGYAVYSTSQIGKRGIILQGIDLEEQNRMNPFTIKDEGNLYPFYGRKIIFSETFIRENGFKTGETIDLDINGEKYKFIICASAKSEGPFVDSGQNAFAIVPMKGLSRLYDSNGMINMLYIKLKNPQEKKAFIDKVSKEYKQFDVGEPFTEGEMKKNTENLETALIFMTIVIAILSVFIIYTSFKVITFERLPMLGTLRSIGATKRTAYSILLIEGLVYGAVGGVGGCLLGLVLKFPIAMMAVKRWSGNIFMLLDGRSLALLFLAVVFSVALSFLSCLFPIIRISRIPVKDIILNTYSFEKSKKKWKLLVSICVLVISILLPPVTPKELSVVSASVSIIMSVVSIILLVPFLTAFTAGLLEKAYNYLWGNIGSLAAKNLRENKNVFNNISLLVIGISSFLMINTVSFSIVTEIVNFYRAADFELWVFRMDHADRNVNRTMLRQDGVEGVYGVVETYNTQIVKDGINDSISIIQGINEKHFFDYWNFNVEGKKWENRDMFEEGRNILLTRTLKEKLNVSEGDIITLKMSRGYRNYKVLGFFNSLRNNGSLALIPEKYLKQDTGISFYSNIYVKASGNTQKLINIIKKDFQYQNIMVSSVEELEKKDKDNNKNIFFVLNGFSVLAMLIGALGVFNNLMVSFMERKRYLAMLRSIGLSKKQNIKMLLIEAFSGGIIGGVLGVITGFIMLQSIPYVLRNFGLYIEIHYPAGVIVIYIAAAVFTVVTAALRPAIKSSRINIIESIKYE